MGRTVRFVLDDKAVDAEWEKPLDLEDHSGCSKKDRIRIRKQPLASNGFFSALPSLRDLVKTILFCAVTVFGLTLISNAIPDFGWRPKSQSTRDEQYQAPVPVAMDACQTTEHSTSLSMDFTDPKKFSFTQMSKEYLARRNQPFEWVHTTGSIEVRTGDRSSSSYVHVDLNVRGSDQRLVNAEALGIAKTDSSLVIKTPRQLLPELAPATVAGRPCLHITVIVTLATGTRLEHLGIRSESIPVIFHPGLDYAETRIVETRNHFDSTSSYSRETVIDVSSATVTGSFPLYDLLSIHTNSGSINVDIVPKNASRQNVKSAILKVTSNSGNVGVSTSRTSVPERDYQTSISTSSGSIEAEVLHGSRTSLRSISGDVSAGLYPYGHNDSQTSIEAHDTSGSIDLALHSSLSHPTAPLNKVSGYYRSVSGNLKLVYPAQWQGTVEGTTLSGSIDLDWQGLRIIKDGKEGHIARFIKAVRGQGEGKLEFHEISGSVKLRGERGGL